MPPERWAEHLQRSTNRNASRRTTIEIDDPEIGAGHFRDIRPAAGCDEHVLGAEPLVADHDGVPVGEYRPSLDDFHPRTLEEPAVDAVEPIDLGADDIAHLIVGVAGRGHRVEHDQVRVLRAGKTVFQ